MRSPRARFLVVALVVAASAILAAGGIAAAMIERGRQTRLAVAMTGGNPDRAMTSIQRYGCAACHQIPGAEAPGGLAAPSLSGIAERVYIGGVTENSPDNLVRWIVDPKKFDRKTAMPVTGIREGEARDVAAYLYRQR